MLLWLKIIYRGRLFTLRLLRQCLRDTVGMLTLAQRKLHIWQTLILNIPSDYLMTVQSWTHRHGCSFPSEVCSYSDQRTSCLHGSGVDNHERCLLSRCNRQIHGQKGSRNESKGGGERTNVLASPDEFQTFSLFQVNIRGSGILKRDEEPPFVPLKSKYRKTDKDCCYIFL